MNGIFFNVSVSERPDGRFVQIHLFYSETSRLTPGEYIRLKNFLSEANSLWRISSHDAIEDPG